ncbi:hypothetical protein I4641_14095 [Waterburya agarophytonicola K14]|uniref:Uncharacterized protein n=1 Tax=Waterburya agarophytonicola KI4 TaxID=2874699 RepID=A0A964BTY1_9CYAN|nr:hypothetical protein [Waterburya agarophytonicola]MCC0178112.1 hypothetical protein [Waterburya agarophytonicola KI4]
MSSYNSQAQLVVAPNYSSITLALPEIKLTQKLWHSPIWILSSLGLFMTLISLVVYGKWKYKQLKKAIQYEQTKVASLEKRLNTALGTIRQWEENPDLINSRDCNLDYIRMRMQESVFRNVLVNQAKVKVKQFVSTAMRINLSQNAGGGIASKNGFNINETFDVTYNTDSQGKSIRRVLFRIQVKLTKLPTQSTSQTINQIVECVEMFLSPTERRSEWQSGNLKSDRRSDNWLPTIQGHIVTMSWNQKAKPTPLLLLEQHSGDVNVSFRTKVARKYRTFTSRKG